MTLPDPPGWDLYRSIVEQASDAIIFADRAGVIRLWNRGAEVVFGYTAEEALGRGLELIVPDKFWGAHHDGFARAMVSGVNRYDGRVLTTRSQNKYGSRQYVDLSFGLVKDESSGLVLGAFAIARDCTAAWLEKAAQRALAQEAAR